MSVEDSMVRYREWLESRRACKEVYGGDCNIYIGPPRWSHRIDRYRSELPSHPTPQQALRAASDPRTDPDVLGRLGRWDPERHPEIRDAARSNPGYPGEEA